MVYFINRPRFVTLGQVENMEVYKNIAYFPMVSKALILFHYLSIAQMDVYRHINIQR